MKFNLALLFLVGFIALAVAVPVEEDDDKPLAEPKATDEDPESVEADPDAALVEHVKYSRVLLLVHQA
ncbi:hypothetical protein QZH41_007696 [Actinostola sp. cb2023]|nr:hypothetical protein QZH41_007696 [Actinostola sp. cb2023]